MNSKEFSDMVYKIKREKLKKLLKRDKEELEKLDRSHSLREKNCNDC